MADDGLPPPPPPVPKAPSIPRGPDLEAGFVKNELTGIVSAQDPFVGKLALAATTAGPPSLTPFKPAGSDGLRPVASTLDKALDTSSPELALARFLGNSVFKPFTSGVDAYQVSKIRDMQEKFFAAHDYTLKKLSEDLGNARIAMRGLGNWLAKQHIPDNGIRGIMEKKAAAGNRAMADLNDALASATDPGDRAKLQAMKGDFDQWTQQRDERLKPEWKEETELENRIDKLNREIYYGQSNGLLNAASSDGPSTDTGGGKVIGSTHQQPEALRYVRSLRDFALKERKQLVGTIRGAT
jgi:hypothetical protein